MWNTAGATGEVFFRTLVIELATTLRVRAAFAGRVTEFPHIKALACYDGGRVVDCATFSPPSTPCTELITKCLPILCPRNARRKYPETQLFQDLHIEAFAGVPILSRSGSPIGVLVIMHDRAQSITRAVTPLLTIAASRASAELERMELEVQRLESEFRMRAVIDNAPFGAHLYELQPNGGLVLIGANRSADRILGIRHHPLVGKTIEEAFPGLAEQGIPDTYRTVALTGVPFEKDIISYSHGEITGAFDVHAFQPSKHHVTAFFQDITARRKAEARIEEESRVKTTLLTNISHEFRTPITGILGLSSLLRDHVADPAQLNMLDGITASASRLHTTLDAIFKIAQLTSGDIRPKCEAVDMDALLVQLHRRFAESAIRKDISLTLPETAGRVAILGDPELATDILGYLIDNAIKYTDHGGVVLRIVDDMTSDGLRCTIEVEDTGIGIAAEHHEEIFGEFRQISEGFGREFEGTGLGLAIARRMTHMLGGTISIKSAVGAGSTFTVSLPGIAGPWKHEVPPPLFTDTLPPGHRPRVLIVEDNFINKMVMQNFLSEVCATDHARNARTAIEMAQAHGYDVILMDINLGAGMDGIQATQEIRKIPGYQGTPIVAVTGYTLAGDRERILSQGLTFYLPKPFDRREIVEVLRNALSTGQQR